MGLMTLFLKAEKIVEKTDPRDRETLLSICRDIQDAQRDLLSAGTDIFARCITRCGGLCCRNVRADSIFSVWDFVLLLTAEPSLKQMIRRCIEEQQLSRSPDCIFLLRGEGPCIFPQETRPEMCIVSFCGDDSPIHREINRVKRKFARLAWFVLLQRFRVIGRSVCRRYGGGRQSPGKHKLIE